VAIQSPLSKLKQHFADLDDPRAAHSIEHLLLDIVLITICAVICGADNWVEIEQYGEAKQAWLATFLELPNGIPSHDTFERLFARLNPKHLQQCFLNWVQDAYEITGGQVIALDGKALRGSFESGNKRSMIYMVSAWATESRLVLGQQKVHEKSNEITAIPELLRVLDLEGAVVTIDAMGCQTAIAEQIVSQKGDYVLALKGNQGNLHKDVVEQFEQARQEKFRGIEHDFYETEDKGHGRQEVRRYGVIELAKPLTGSDNWAKLTSIGCVESQRTMGAKTTIDTRYYLLSLPPNAVKFAHSVRGHWGIENQLHWILDVGFREDQSRVSQGYGAENLAVVRHIAVNLLSQEKSIKVGTHAKRMKAGWDDQFLFKVLANPSQGASKV
jgi:predicted transposase YbfD/YdcC